MAQALPSGVILEDNRGPEMNRSISVVAGLATLALVARLVARRLKKASLGASDYAVVVGWLTAWGCNMIMYIMVHLGLDRHIEVVLMRDIEEMRELKFASEILYTITLVAVKISVLLFYRSIFTGRAFAIVVNVTSAFVIAWGLALILVSIFTCKPIHGFWDITVPSTCISTRGFFLVNEIPNICMDVFILSPPVRKVWQLQMPVRQKVLVSGLFLLGGFVCVSSGVRLYMSLSVDEADPSRTYYGVAVWCAVEANTAVISTCLPTIRPVLQLAVPIFHSLVSSSKSSRNPALRGTSSNVLKGKEGDVFHRLPEILQGHNVPSKPAKGTYVNNIGLQTDPEGGALLVKDEVT